MNKMLVHVQASIFTPTATMFDPVWYSKIIAKCSDGRFKQNHASIPIFPKEIEPIITGLLLILLVLFLPEGLLSILSPKHRATHPMKNLGRIGFWFKKNIRPGEKRTDRIRNHAES